jgi:hypothetical protein
LAGLVEEESLTMVDPHNITDYSRNDYSLQEFLLFAPAVAGKKAVMISPKIDAFLKLGKDFVESYYGVKNPTPLKIISLLCLYHEYTHVDMLLEFMKEVKLGKYTVLRPSYAHLAMMDNDGKFDWRKVTPSQLECVNGFSFKTSRFFILHTQPNAKIGVIDTHILDEMIELGFMNLITSKGYSVPTSTPQNPKVYKILEDAWLSHCDNLGVGYAEHDLNVWRRRTKTKPLQMN